ncbi:MAG TPA: DUF4878 domain-containing protein [Thermoanaerobaculia bacterium]|nr:DUF4878 domain-containing protein [Thermoanaerobaculia bacterium]
MKPKTGTAIACLALVLVSGCLPSGPAQTAREFYDNVGAGEIEAAIDLLSSQIVSQLGREKLRAGLRELARDIQGKGGIEKVEVTEESVQGEIATVSVTVRFGDGSTESETMHLVREDGAWRIQPEK